MDAASPSTRALAAAQTAANQAAFEADAKIHLGALVSDDAELIGDITIGAGTIIHPKVTITAEPGAPIVIGENCMIEERAVLKSKVDVNETMTIGHHNHIQCATALTACNLGNGNVVEALAKLNMGCEVVDACVIGAAVNVPAHFEALGSCSVLYGCKRAGHDPTKSRGFEKAVMPPERHERTFHKHTQTLCIQRELLTQLWRPSKKTRRMKLRAATVEGAAAVVSFPVVPKEFRAWTTAEAEPILRRVEGLLSWGWLWKDAYSSKCVLFFSSLEALQAAKAEGEGGLSALFGAGPGVKAPPAWADGGGGLCRVVSEMPSGEASTVARVVDVALADEGAVFGFASSCKMAMSETEPAPGLLGWGWRADGANVQVTSIWDAAEREAAPVAAAIRGLGELLEGKCAAAPPKHEPTRAVCPVQWVPQRFARS